MIAGRLMTLILVGVVHRDPDGYERLSDLLDELRPEALTVELSPLGLLWREARGRQLLEALQRLTKGLCRGLHSHGQIELLREGLQVPFEFVASLAYAERHGAPLHLVDLNWVSWRFLPLYESEALTMDNLIRLGNLPPEPVRVLVERAYLRAAGCLRRGLCKSEREAATWRDVTGRRRERLLACRVRRVAERHARVAHIGGWVHLVHDEEGSSLASLLSDLRPRRVLLEGGDGPLALP